MADHEFFGTVSAQAGSASDHLLIKSQIDSLIATAQARANHTGTQLAATISDFNSAVDSRVQLVVDAAPAALDTLNELAAALGDDADFAGTVTTQISGLDTRIDALEAAGGTSVYKENIGDGVLSAFTITHNLGTLDIDVIVRRISDGQRVYPVDAAASTNTATVDFGSVVPTTGQYRVIVTAH
jgi:hypothetical protein